MSSGTKNKGKSKIIKDLRDAIDTLSHFTTPDRSKLPGSRLKIQSLAPTKLTSLIRCYLAATFSDQVRKQHKERRNDAQSQLIKAVEFLKKHYFIIDKLKYGSSRERALADTALDTIDAFNQLVKESQARSSSLKQHITRFLLRKSGLSLQEPIASSAINLPPASRVQCWSPDIKKTPNPLSESCITAQTIRVPTFHKLITQQCNHDDEPSHRESDAFKVKGITLIRDYGFPSTSLSEILSTVRQEPIESISKESITKSHDHTVAVVTFRQTLEPFPGEVFILEGAFRRNSQDRVQSVPIPDSFKLLSKSSQTGFPAPSQHTGWALSDTLIPSFPDALYEMPQFAALYQQKRRIAENLLPEGQLLLQAKTLLVQRWEAFHKVEAELIKQHKEILFCLNSGNKSTPLKNFCDSLDSSTPSKALKQIISFHRWLMRCCVLKPHEAVQDLWLGLNEKTSTPLTLDRLRQRYSEAVDKETSNPIVLQKLGFEAQEALKELSLQLGPACCDLILQYMSEKMGFSPPHIAGLAQKLQIILYEQLRLFQQSFESGTRRCDLEIMLLEQLDNELLCLRSQDPTKVFPTAATVVEELKHYYEQKSQAEV